MTTQISFIIFTALILIILFLVNAYHKQKIINSFLIKEIEIRGYISLLSGLIQKRQSQLEKYDFQRYNLREALSDKTVE